MNGRTVTIIIATSIPVIVVSFILLQHYLEEDPKFEKCEGDGVCVRLCCEEDSFCDDTYNMTAHKIADSLNVSYKIIKNKPCKKVFPLELNGHKFLENGHILEGKNTDDEIDSILHWDEYCLDIDNHTLDIANHTIIVNICEIDDITEKLHETFAYFMLASMPFLIITLAVYGFLKDLRNLHGKCLMTYVFSLTLMYTTLITIKFYDGNLSQESKFGCSTIGYTFLTSVLCCFFWLNIMCYDIYRTFREGMKTEDNKQFFKYCGYAFGIPIIISIINFTLNNFELIPNDYNSGIGTITCTVLADNRTVQWIYIYLPVMLLLVINVSFYGITAWKIFSVQKETSTVCKSENSGRHSRCQDNTTRFFLYMRLSIVMGVPWIVELCSFILGDSVILFIASIFNCMQGFVVFITFVWNPKVTKQLKRRYTAMSVSYKKNRSSTKKESAKQESVKRDSVETVVTKINGITSESSAQV
ncbi:unnamed protein product [Chironomus riparius]|uniref:G-protein coupled receptors family 2 profile 2 domain-containing protein n=1 Tax=Chironomus riparius TaxID=315576 RepID=A0A9N9WW64_9DIPT|nr:unnamed protein product [Chironomus riparius]